MKLTRTTGGRFWKAASAAMLLISTTARAQPAPVEPPTAAPRPPEGPVPEKKEDVSPLVPPDEPAKMKARDTKGATFKPGKGLSLESEDKDFGLNIGFYVQLLTTYLNDHKADEETLGIQFKRARLQLSGNTFGEHNKFKIEIGFSPDDIKLNKGTVTQGPIMDMYAEFDYLRDLTFRVGQYKVPFSYQRLYSDSALQLIDSSINSQEFNLDRDIGFDFRSKDLAGLGLFRYYAGIFAGDGRNSFESDEADLLYVARGEVMPLGAFEDPGEQDFDRGRPRLLVGAAYAYLDNAKRLGGTRGDVPADQGTTDIRTLTADATFRAMGLSARADIFFRNGKRNAGPLAGTLADPTDPTSVIPVQASRDGIGWGLQVGYLIPQMPLEFAARFAKFDPPSNPDAQNNGLPHNRELGGGVSYYFARNQLKVQGDYFRLWSAEAAGGVGGIDAGKDQVRVQLQVAF